MLKIAQALVDIYTDHGYRIARTLPAQFHSCQPTPEEHLTNLPDCCFAAVVKTAGEVIRRRWPLATEDDVKLSEAYLLACSPQLPDDLFNMAMVKIAAAKARLAKAAEFNLPGQTAPLKTAEYDGATTFVDTSRYETPVDNPTEHVWGLTIDGRNFFPLTTPGLVKEAESRFALTASGLEPEQAFVYARNIYKQATAHGIEIPVNSPVHAYTNNEVSVSALASAIRRRKEAAYAAGVSSAALDELAELARCPLQRGDVESDDSYRWRQVKQANSAKIEPDQIIRFLQTFDAALGGVKYANATGIPDPFASCFKRAAASLTIVDGMDLSRLDYAKLTKVLGPGPAEELRQDPVAVYKSMPIPIRKLIGSCMRVPPAVPEHEEPAAARGNPRVVTGPAYSNGPAEL